jgi:hypothetical protein
VKFFIAIVILVFLVMVGSTMLAGFWRPPQPEPVTPTVELTLTALAVSSAADIENAARDVTAGGTRPGILYLDGADGPFVYEGDDRTINIFYTNLKFIGKNQASFPNADDGFFFDDVYINNIHIENLFMVCKGSAVTGAGRPQNVEVRSSTFQTGGPALIIQQGQGVQILGNTISADQLGVQILGGSAIFTSYNQISAPEGIRLEGVQQSAAAYNTIDAGQGITLLGEASTNQIFQNVMFNVQRAGIALQPGTKENHVRDNRVACAREADCQTVDDPAEGNDVRSNLP